MSMICGIRGCGGAAAEELDPLLTELPGRSTDVFGTWADPSVALGWRGRGSGEEGAESPRRDAAPGLAITASVRLDARAALCGTLGVSGPDRTELPDTALLLRSYARWGRACLDRLLGDFAFALWDAKREVLFCARDHVGARPFYYALAGERFVFASDIAAVLAAPEVSDELDEAVVATRLTWGARFLGERTFYRAVRRLLPGHALTVERGTPRIHRWWRPEEAPARSASDDALAEECREILTEAVRDRVRDGRPVAVHLSGGLDSSGVAVLAARELRRQARRAPPAFAWFPPPEAGPRTVAGDYGAFDPVGRQEDLQLFCRPPEARDFVASLRRDGTRGGGKLSVREMLVQRAAGGMGVEVLLSGWGGDEGISFNGRDYYPELLRSGRVRQLWRDLRERSRRPLAAFAREALLPTVSPGAAHAVRGLRRGEWPFRNKPVFIHPEFARRVRPLPEADTASRNGSPNLRARLLRRGHLSDRMEDWAASGARHGIEYRYPLLDRRVLEFAVGLPSEQFRRGRWSRWLMRRALDPVLPPQVCWNADKADPPPFESTRDALGEALVRMREMIREREGVLSRARYLNLPRLLEHLDPERWRASGRRAPLLNALRFLDF